MRSVASHLTAASHRNELPFHPATGNTSPMRILVALDLSDATESILAVARRAAKASNGSIILLHVADPDPDFVGYEVGPQVVRDQVAHGFRDQHRALHTLAEELRREGIETTALLIQGEFAKC